MALVSITAGPDGWQGEQDLFAALQALPDGAAVTAPDGARVPLCTGCGGA